MDRNQYLKLRIQGVGVEILYNLVKDKYTKPLNTFGMEFTSWAIHPQVKQDLIIKATDYFDKKFAIVILSYKDKFINFS